MQCFESNGPGKEGITQKVYQRKLKVSVLLLLYCKGSPRSSHRQCHYISNHTSLRLYRPPAYTLTISINSIN